MAADLQELKDRIAWAQGKSVVLGAQIRDFLDTRGFALERTHSPDTGYTELFIVKKADVPPAIRIETGSIVHELRATLDALACQLAIRNKGRAVDTYFPISADSAVFEKDGRKKIRNLSEADRAAIEALKPFGGGNDLLFALHRTDIIGKHQRLVMTGGYAGADLRGMMISELSMNGGGMVNDRLPIARWRGNNTFRIKVSVDLCFSEPPPIAGRPLVATLDNFASLVQSIVKMFD
ncbi:MAG: hypothetical protein JNN24_03335 [Hyphomicrobium zavarzinii]|jgi:hypothetical protein|uniref:hypothetical protein n=1 Tax=Hyphomicrobium zavarzinii TaxID=48292 RepID=UPI001A3D10A2|nr:hypothetical protein [Hyphomicrobium zavarzinii]MBL8844783.1 hypothetical protein [Hyphomicrobium zavarzinii]